MPSSSIRRFSRNPLVSPSEVKPSHPDLEVLGSFNPGATLYNGRKLLLVRVAERPIQEPGYISTAVNDEETGELQILRFRKDDPKLDASDPRLIRYDGTGYVTSISHFRKAISEDDESFVIDEQPTLTGSGHYETYGVEDARITRVEDEYYISHTGVSEYGVLANLARTRDFQTFEKLGVMFGPDNKDVAIFPEKIGGRYFALHRPALKHLGRMTIWLASSDNLRDWGQHHALISPRPHFWDCERVGAGAAPIKTPQGWLVLYHASDHNIRYATGALLLDLEEPWKVLARADEPFLYPEAPYELEGFMPNIIFHNGHIENGDGSIDLFYGGADEVTCGATVLTTDILATLKS